VADFQQILVDGVPVGMRGLHPIFTELQADGVAPGDPGLPHELVKRAGRDNYIPRSAEDVFGAALAREYAAFLARQNGDAGTSQRGYGSWRGHPREQIPWFPTVDQDLCDGCNVCLRMCSTKALQPTENGKVWVAEPFACVVGCSACANLCKPGAIIFPPRAMLDAYQATGGMAARPAPRRRK
jgi:NAD-dependent dihydropyrimidine dehydrogenase PreA subunit